MGYYDGVDGGANMDYCDVIGHSHLIHGARQQPRQRPPQQLRMDFGGGGGDTRRTGDADDLTNQSYWRRLRHYWQLSLVLVVNN